jgi:hypothetical protein
MKLKPEEKLRPPTDRNNPTDKICFFIHWVVSIRWNFFEGIWLTARL